MDGEEINVAGGPTKHNNAETRAENGGPLVRSAETVHSSGPKVSSVPIAIEPAAKSPDAPRPSSCPPGPPCSSPMVHDRRSNSTNDLKRDRSASQTSQTQTDQIPVLELDDLKVPIVGYEIMEQRAKFTVFKLLVNRGPNDNWFVFRRYTDFVRINEQLKVLFPTFRLALPPKKWFGNNFDTSFLEDRQLGLQAFINNITGHKDIVKRQSVIYKGMRYY
ncbi:uncharacterized protein LOC102807147 [Saccoglossus kowalevskii]|uniref:Sorting nexin-16-like n=1 Tax=Saccoglossus kowalevskii TaxID=10224 RepID=A0ABM0MKR7_SACKO|nr:PREDICTED: sorting nexin-16-like [Saccoglossus kowalevskii]